MSRVAAIDCGTNSLRLLVADLDPVSGTLVDVERQMHVVRLGQGVDRTGELAPEALERTFAVCRAYAARIEALGATRVRMVATSATRDAANSEVFLSGVTGILGRQPEIISGEEEARLSFLGATAGLASAEPPFLVLDIGGGSTELIVGRAGVQAAESMDVGAVRLTERHFGADPPTPAQLGAARADVDSALAFVAGRLPLGEAAWGDTGTAVGVAGTVTTVAAMVLDLPRYDPDALHERRLSAPDISGAASRLIAMSAAERARLPYLHPGRADVIAAGALILATLVERIGIVELVVSERDILDGIAASLLD